MEASFSIQARDEFGNTRVALGDLFKVEFAEVIASNTSNRTWLDQVSSTTSGAVRYQRDERDACKVG